MGAEASERKTERERRRGPTRGEATRIRQSRGLETEIGIGTEIRPRHGRTRRGTRKRTGIQGKSATRTRREKRAEIEMQRGRRKRRRRKRRRRRRRRKRRR